MMNSQQFNFSRTLTIFLAPPRLLFGSSLNRPRLYRYGVAYMIVAIGSAITVVVVTVGGM